MHNNLSKAVVLYEWGSTTSMLVPVQNKTNYLPFDIILQKQLDNNRYSTVLQQKKPHTTTEKAKKDW